MLHFLFLSFCDCIFKYNLIESSFYEQSTQNVKGIALAHNTLARDWHNISLAIIADA